MSDASRPLSLALARASALGAAARLAQHWVNRFEEPQREGKVRAAARCVMSLLQAFDRHLPEVCARSAPPMHKAHVGSSWSADAARAGRQDCPLLDYCTPPVEPSSNEVQGASFTLVAAVARFEAEAAQRIPADTLPEASLEDLRLQTPALRPVGCWCMGCARAVWGCHGQLHSASERPLTSVPQPRRCRNLSGATEAGLQLQLCSGCNTARYCSETCQKAAWRAGHKGACRRL